MKDIRLTVWDSDVLAWIEQNCSDFTILEYALSPVTFQAVPAKIRLLTERDMLLYTLKWLS